MRFTRWYRATRFTVVLTVLLCALAAWSADPPTLTPLDPDTLPPVPTVRPHGPSAEVQPYQVSGREEIYRLRVINDANGEIAGSLDSGTTWETLGHVVHYTQKASDQGYTASKWAPMSSVAATAVNAIHIRVGYNEKEDKGMVFSILPQELMTEAGIKLSSYLSPDASIYTDIPGGTGIFGGHWSPILGNPIFLQQADGLQPLPLNYQPKKGDVYIILVLQPVDMPKAIIFENRYGGMIYLQGWDNSLQTIGQVLKPVAGVGRFTGTQYCDVGRLRANHCGVIDISVSPLGKIGGFQIIPRDHAMSPEMGRARTMTQWMVVGPLDARDPSWEGTAPLFLDYLRPAYSPDDWDAPDWEDKVADRVMVDVRVKNGAWGPMPSFFFDPDLTLPVPEWAFSAIEDITHIRILLPIPKSVREGDPLPTLPALPAPTVPPTTPG
jgi:hypothetical protein